MPTFARTNRPYRMSRALRRLPARVFAAALPAVCLLVLCGCGDGGRGPAPEATAPDANAPGAASQLPPPIAEVYRTHADALPADRDVAYDLDLTFGGKPRYRGRITQSPSMDRLRVRRAADGAELRYDGTRVALVRSGASAADTSAADAGWPRARFDVFTWPYFFAAPFKLADPGTRWASMRDWAWADGEATPGAKLTFASGTGDAPDDYYVVVPDAAGRLGGMAYIVTLGKDAAAIAAAEPHAIRYGDYRDVGGVPVAHAWTFYNWNERDGLNGEPIGHATLDNVTWVERDAAAYTTAGGEAVAAPE